MPAPFAHIDANQFPQPEQPWQFPPHLHPPPEGLPMAHLPSYTRVTLPPQRGQTVSPLWEMDCSSSKRWPQAAHL